MNLAFGLYLSSFVLSLLALAFIPFVRRRRAGATLWKSGEPGVVLLTLLLLVPAAPALGGRLGYWDMVWITIVVFYAVLQWLLLGRAAAAIVRQLRLPGWIGVAAMALGLVGLSVLHLPAYLSFQTWLLPPSTVLLAIWSARRASPALADLNA